MPGLARLRHIVATVPFKIAAAYVVAGIAWIFTSDRLVELLIPSPAVLGIAQTAKGFVYVVGTGVVLWYLIDRHTSRINAARAALAESEQRVRTLFETIPLGIVYHDKDGRIIAANPTAEEILGMTLAELRGRSSLRCELAAEEQPAAVALRTRAPVAGIVTSVAHPSEHKRRWMLLAAVPLFHDAEVYPSQVYTTIEEITQRKEAEEALRQSERRYRLLAQNATDVIWTLDLSFRYTYVSPSVSRLSGYAPEEILHRRIDDVLSPQSAARARATFARVVENDDDGTSDPVTVCLDLRRTDGSAVPTEVTTRLLRDEDREPIGLLSVARDLTERRHAEQERSHLEAQLRQAQKLEAIGRLAGGVAHDFNNILSVVMGHAELALLRVGGKNPIRATLGAIQQAAARGAGLTRQLLAFARRQPIAPRRLDLNAIIDETRGMLLRLIGEDVALLFVPGPQLWPVTMDPSQIDQVLANLAVNARDAIAGVGTLTIETANAVLDIEACAGFPGMAPGQYVRLTVRDSGSGMDHDVRARAFEPFFTTKPAGQGTGLGLSTVFGIVKQNDGFIDVISTPGHGTTFTIYLPRAAGPSVAPEERSGTVAPRGTETILIVEDEEEVLSLCEAALVSRGYTVIAAPRPEHAIETCRTRSDRIDMLITDVVMPSMNGRELMRHVEALQPGIRTLFMSGYTADVIAHRGVLGEGTHFIQKPFSMLDLAAKVRAVLDERTSGESQITVEE